MLTLAGLGLWDEKDLTLRGVEAAKQADKVYIELYTSRWHGKEQLEKLIGKEATELKRDDLEQNSDKIIEEAKKSNVVVFVPGDPLVATTHLILVEAAKKAEIPFKIIHNASIASAICETGLHLYKFGATATIPFPEKTENTPPESVYNTLKKNKKAGLHTLLLLDITPERCMTPNEGMETLLDIEKSKKEGIFTENAQVVVLTRVGSKDSELVFGQVKDLINLDFGEPPMVIVVPSKLHFTEKEYLESL